MATLYLERHDQETCEKMRAFMKALIKRLKPTGICHAGQFADLETDLKFENYRWVDEKGLVGAVCDLGKDTEELFDEAVSFGLIDPLEFGFVEGNDDENENQMANHVDHLMWNQFDYTSEVNFVKYRSCSGSEITLFVTGEMIGIYANHIGGTTYERYHEVMVSVFGRCYDCFGLSPDTLKKKYSDLSAAGEYLQTLQTRFPNDSFPHNTQIRVLERIESLQE